MRMMKRHWMVCLALILFSASAFGQSATNLLVNSGFETGNNGADFWSIPKWTSWEQWGGQLVSSATTPTHSGTNCIRMNAFASDGAWNKGLLQDWTAASGVVYECEGWMKSPAGTDYFRPTNGYCAIIIQFFQGTTLVGEEHGTHFVANGPTNWTQFTTGPVLAPAGTTTGKVMCFHLPNGDKTTTGYVYWDDMRTFTNTSHKAGVLNNAGFEVRNGTGYLPLTNLPFWSGFGNAGGVDTNFARSGNRALSIWSVDQLAGQTWSATRSNKYATSAWIYSTNFTTTGAWAQVILQFLDSTNGVLKEYPSARFDSRSASNTWIQYEAIGVAPSGTVFGRTMLGIVGDSAGFGTSSAWFDDATQRLVSTTGTVAGLIRNGGFDDGPSGNAYTLENSQELPAWDWMGGDNAGYVNQTYKTNGEQSLSITYPANSIGQDFTATTGKNYCVEGYIYNPSSEKFSGSAYGTLTLEFYKGTNLVSTYDSAHFTSSSASNAWLKFSVTNRAPWSGSVSGRVVCAINGSVVDFGGALYFDALNVSETNLPTITNTQAGALWNPGFDFTAPGTLIGQMDNWSGVGEAGFVLDTYKKSGMTALKLLAPNNFVQQDWSATQGWRYASSAFAFTPSADRFSGASNLHAIVQMIFLDASSNTLLTYESSWFMTNATANVWTNLQVAGTAPAGTKYGRTLIGLFGDSAGFSGSVWFDDATQTLVSTTGTVAGLLVNPGFDDGPVGNCYNLEAANDLPAWNWLGGTNGGFVQATYKYDGSQALSITYPSNLVAQSLNVATGRTCVFEGYMFTPSAAPLAGSAYGVLIMEFYKNGDLVSVVESDHFTSSSPSNQWVKFAVTNRAPWSGSVTCRVYCAVLGNPVGFGGSVYFDGLSVNDSYIGLTNTQAGAIWNPGFEYTTAGTLLEQLDSWTALGTAGIVSSAIRKSGVNSLRFYGPETMAAQTWVATAGYKYASSAFAYTPSADRLSGVSNLHGVVLLQFFDATGTNMLISYESPWFTTNSAVNVWSNLEVIGVAPKGSVYGRTVIGLLGADTGFGGSLYFDDTTQRVVATGGSLSGLLHNPGFDDGPSGNAYVLEATNDLPYWQWIGGTNAGFVARDHVKDNEQALTITYPLNGIRQNWTAGPGKAYKAGGYLFTPAAAKFNTDGKSYGRLEINFFVDGDTNAYTAATAVSAPFGADQPSNTWVYFSVTGFAPVAASVVTGRLTCTIACEGDPATDSALAGAIYFDQLSLEEITLTADVAVAVADMPDPVRIGTNLTYTISVTNMGPQAAGNVTVTDILPTNVTFVSCLVSQGSYTQSDDAVTCDLGTMGASATAAVTLVVTPTITGIVTNDVAITTSSEEGTVGSNRASCVTTILAQNRSPEIVMNPAGPYTLIVGSSTSILVYAQDQDHDPLLTITNTVRPSGATYINSNLSWTAGAAFAGTTNELEFVADDHVGDAYSVVTSRTVIVVPFDSNGNGINDGWEWIQFTNLTTSSSGDNDQDSMNNYAEYLAGTQPTNANSVFKILSCSGSSGSSNRTIKVSTELNRKYTIYFADGKYSNNLAWTPFLNSSTGIWVETRGSTNYTFTDNESSNTTGGPMTLGTRYYKVKVTMP